MSIGVAASADAVPASPARSGARKGVNPRWRRGGRAVTGVAIAIGLWAAVTASGAVDTTIFPTVPAFVGALADSWRELLVSFEATLQSWALGMVVGAALGIILGVIVGRSYWADASSDIIVRMLRPLPSLALIPIAVLVAGLGITMTASLVAFASFWPIFINTRYAVRQIEPRLLDSGRAVGLSGWSLVTRVIAPAIAPAVVTGVRVSVGIAIVVTVSVQLVAGTGGLGGYVLNAQTSGLTNQVFVGVAAGGVLGWLLNGVFLLAARKLMPWQAARGSGA
jgi:ABC-type nitrate/sulfonate/bicarbonate transport system permease component